MWLKAIRLRNFGPFTKEQEFRFAGEPGLYFLTGNNRVNLSLGANGCGKSKLWGGLTWCFFGKDPRDLVGTELSSWSVMKDTRVEVDFVAADKQEVTLRRTWNPNALTLRGRTREDALFHEVTQAEVDAYLGLSLAPFLHSIMLGQFNDLFLDLGPTEKTNLVSSVLNLDQWIAFADKAGERTKSLDRDRQRLEVDDGTLRGRLEELRRLDLTPKIEEWEQARIARCDVLTVELNTATAERSKHQVELDTKAVMLANRKSVRAEHTRQMVEYRDQANGLRHLINADTATLARAEADKANYAERRTFFEKHDHCIACNQPIPIAHKHEQSDLINGMIAAKEDEVKLVRSHREKLTADAEHAEKQQRYFSEQSQELGQEIAQLDSDIRVLQQRIAENNRTLGRIDAETQRMMKEENPYAREQEEARSKQRVVQRDIFRTGDQLELVNKQATASGYWVKGFRNLRLQMISEALTQLELEVNNMIEQLGLHGWALEFDVDSVTKSNTVKRGFSVAVKSPHNPTAVAWESWSGGETQRLRLAAQMGLSNLILNHLGVTCNVEIWDEPSNHLNEGGVEDMINVLRDRAQRVGKEIWLTDHRAFDAGGFSKVVTVLREREGSRFV